MQVLLQIIEIFGAPARVEPEPPDPKSGALSS